MLRLRTDRRKHQSRQYGRPRTRAASRCEGRSQTMTPNKGTILVGYDGSAAAHASLRWAAETARLGGHDVRALVVHPDHSPASGARQTTPDAEVVARAQEVLTAAGVNGTAERATGDVVPVLLREAMRADMLVVGNKGRGWVAETVRGSVSQLLARHSPCPIVVVRPAERREAARIVVGVDGSEESLAALEFACRRADFTKESVVALHAWNAGHVDVDRRGQLPNSVGDRAQIAEVELAECVAVLHERHPSVVLERETIAVPAAEALTGASATASLVVTGSRGHGVVAGVLLGSVSHRLLRRARCPVAVVRQRRS